ncbi:MAG: hypothetical protein M1827_007122 [Pycnora praestabilis]|nr:MAG: hypothetical protein M1827_007122 [Pycnora praestabilis]
MDAINAYEDSAEHGSSRRSEYSGNQHQTTSVSQYNMSNYHNNSPNPSLTKANLAANDRQWAESTREARRAKKQHDAMIAAAASLGIDQSYVTNDSGQPCYSNISTQCYPAERGP